MVEPRYNTCRGQFPVYSVPGVYLNENGQLSLFECLYFRQSTVLYYHVFLQTCWYFPSTTGQRKQPTRKFINNTHDKRMFGMSRNKPVLQLCTVETYLNCECRYLSWNSVYTLPQLPEFSSNQQSFVFKDQIYGPRLKKYILINWPRICI